MFPTLKMHICRELDSSELVYERFHPNSASISEKLTILFTQLFPIGGSLRNSSIDSIDQSKLEPYYKLKNNEDKTLVFESRFECGNLCLVLKV